MEEKEKEQIDLEFDDEEIFVRQWLDDQPKLIKTQVNNMIKLMAKHSDISISMIYKMYCDDFFRNLEIFKKKKRLQTKFDFLEMK